MTVSLIVAVSENGVIGRDGDLPWHLSADLKRFKKLTMGNAIVMGRKTWDSLGRPLPGRTSLVISRQADFSTDYDEVLIGANLDDAMRQLRNFEEIFIIGGASIYELALSMVDRLHITRVHSVVEGDTYFPGINWDAWELIEETHHEADDRNDHNYSFQIFERKQ